MVVWKAVASLEISAAVVEPNVVEEEELTEATIFHLSNCANQDRISLIGGAGAPPTVQLRDFTRFLD